ncbi:MAG TPA: hypothetical protein VFW46_14080 [Stellaceae bacterium]|nr:hypothetical protein [Stellaceae bacterium]
MSVSDEVVTSIATLRPVSPANDEPKQLTGKERRESERAIAYWEKKIAELGGSATVASLDLGEMQSEEWSHRFVIAVDPVVENSALLLYGADFGRLLDLPEKRAPHVPMVRQLPKRYSDVFIRGCGDADREGQPIRLEGSVERDDGKNELFRAAFIPVGVRENSMTHIAFGAFNSCVAEQLAA